MRGLIRAKSTPNLAVTRFLHMKVVMTNRFYATGGVEGTGVSLECPGKIFATELTGARRPINIAYLSAVESESSRS
jgi:hypothetical protein